MASPDIHRLIEFQRLLQEFSNVERRLHRRHNGEFIPENDTEHSYNLAMTAWLLCQSFPHLDTDRVIRLALIHDFVEVFAGDTYVYGEPSHISSKQEREEAALQKLKAEWPDFPELTEEIEAYETRTTEEAKFIYALDKIMPILLIYIGNGHTWHKEGITLQKLDDLKRSQVAISPEIESYYVALFELLQSQPELFG